MALQDTDTDMYADDSTAQAKTTPELEEKLSSDAAKVSTWCQENQFTQTYFKLNKRKYYSTSYLELQCAIQAKQFHTSLFDKHDHFNFRLIFPSESM